MRSLLKTGISVLLVGGLLVSSTGSLVEAKPSGPGKRVGDVTYKKDLGKTKPYGKGKYYPMNVVARGIVNKGGKTVDSSFELNDVSLLFPSYFEVLYYKKGKSGKFSYYGKSKKHVFSWDIRTTIPSGTYYSVINMYKAKGDILNNPKYDKYSTVTKQFYHSGEN